MITKVWLRPQPKKSISYPDCYPSIKLGFEHPGNKVNILDNDNILQAQYSLDAVVRLEFIP